MKEKERVENIKQDFLQDKELAYIAGLFDTEVAFHINQNNRSYSLGVSYTKTDYDILKYLSSIFGGTIYKAKPQSYTRHRVWQWNIRGKAAYEILKRVYPFLHIRRESAENCIEFFDLYGRGIAGQLVSTERQEIGVKYKKMLEVRQRKPGSSKNATTLLRKIKESKNISEITAHDKVTKEDENRYNLPSTELSDVELAYIAGLLDAESAFLISQIHNRNSYLLEVKYRKADYDTLKYLANIFGGKVRPSPRSTKNVSNPWLWLVNSAKAYRLIRQVYPFLHIKRRSAEICMEFFEAYWTGRYGIPVSTERQAIGRKYKALLQMYQPKSMKHKKRKESPDSNT